MQAADGSRSSTTAGGGRLPASAPARRLRRIHDAVAELIEVHAPEAAALEESYVGADARTALFVGQARGAVLVACAGAGLDCAEYPPATVKQAVCGYGRADKAQVGAMVTAILRLPEPPGSTTPPTRSPSRSATPRPRRSSLPEPRDDRAPARTGRSRATADSIVLDVGGVGYRLHATPRAIQQGGRRARRSTLETHLHVREDALQLYGFADAGERELFELLLAVTGVGPKVALAIVSGYAPAELRRAIVREDAALFESIPGIGAQDRAARRARAEGEDRAARRRAVGRRRAAGDDEHTVARDALVELGFSVGRGGEAPRRHRSRPAGRRAGAPGAAGRVSAAPERVTAAVLAPEDDELERSLRPQPAGRLRRPGARQGAARRSRSRRRRGGRRRSTTSCSPARPGSGRRPSPT